MAERKEAVETESLQKIERPVVKKEQESILPRREAGVPREVASWLEEVEKRPSVNVYDDKTGQAVLQVSDPIDDDYQLPINRLKFVGGFKKKVEDVAKWFSVFVLRIIKKKQGKVKFKQENE